MVYGNLVLGADVLAGPILVPASPAGDTGGTVTVTGSKSFWLARALLGQVLGRGAYTPSATIYVALSNADYDPAATGDDLNEATGPGYQRLAVVNTSAAWPADTGAVVSTRNHAKLLFATPTGDWGTVRSYYLLDAPTGGHSLYGANLTAPTPVPAGPAPYIPAGALIVAEA